MEQIEVRINKISTTSAKGSVHVSIDDGSFTISNILIRENDGNLQVSLPLVKIGERKHPAITLQGGLKKRIFEALEREYQRDRI